VYDPVTLTIDQDTIKFTPDGKIAVLDAIASLCAELEMPNLWQRLISFHPELAEVCASYSFANQPPALVADGDGWEKIQTALFELLFTADAEIML